MRAGTMVQEGHQKPIASNPKKFGICGIRGMDGQSVSTKNWRRTARVFDDVGTRTTSTQDRWSYRHGCSMKNAAGVWRSEVRQESIVRHCQRLKELLKQRKSQTCGDCVVEDQHRLGGADAEASESLSTSAAGSISSQGEEAGLAKPTTGDSTKNAETFGPTVAFTRREGVRKESKGGRR